MHVYGEIIGKLTMPKGITGTLTVPQYVYPPTYTGAYEVTPSAETQTLETDTFYMNGNITINPIPNNYGLITYNGSTITVS